jgi:hypothetical protein
MCDLYGEVSQVMNWKEMVLISFKVLSSKFREGFETPQ